MHGDVMSCDVDDFLEALHEQARAPLTHNDEANKHDVVNVTLILLIKHIK